MAGSKQVSLNFVTGAAIWVVIFLVASAFNAIAPEELALILAAVLTLPLYLLLDKRLSFGRQPIALGVSGIAFSAGAAALSFALYVPEPIRLIFLPAFLLVLLSAGYLMFALFTVNSPGSE